MLENCWINKIPYKLWGDLIRLICAALALSTAAWANSFPLMVDDPVVLEKLASQGFSFSQMAFASSSPVVQNSELMRFSGYQQIVERLSQDLKQLWECALLIDYLTVNG